MTYSMIILLFFYINYVNAYFSKTHKFLGSVYQEYLISNNITLYNLIKDTTNIHNFADDSIWADQIKYNKNYTWSRSLHYIDINECNFDKDTIDRTTIYKYCNNNCIVSAILNKTNDLKDNYNNHIYQIKENSENFKFLIHFLQDITQPLHTLGFERGGNNDKIILVKDNKKIYTNMHTVWDSFLPEYYIQNNAKINDILKKNIYQIKLINIYEFEEYLLQNLKTIYNIGCKFIDFKTKEIIFTEYYKINAINIEKMFITYNNLIVNTINFIYN